MVCLAGGQRKGSEKKIRHVIEFFIIWYLRLNKSGDRTKERENFRASKALHLFQSVVFFFK